MHKKFDWRTLRVERFKNLVSLEVLNFESVAKQIGRLVTYKYCKALPTNPMNLRESWKGRKCKGLIKSPFVYQ